MKVTDRSVNIFVYKDNRDADVLEELIETLEQLRVPTPLNVHNQPSIVLFNDSPKTTHQDILNILDLTIQRLETEQ